MSLVKGERGDVGPMADLMEMQGDIPSDKYGELRDVAVQPIPPLL